MRVTRSVDILRLPGLGRLLHWRWGRLVVQVPLLTEYNKHKETL
jgi:hypothetical protein